MGQTKRFTTFDPPATPESAAFYDGEWKEKGEFIRIFDSVECICKNYTSEHT